MFKSKIKYKKRYKINLFSKIDFNSGADYLGSFLNLKNICSFYFLV